MKQQPAMLTQALFAGGIAVVVATALSVLCAPIVQDFFPYTEEWKLLLPSLPQFAHPLQWFSGFGNFMTEPYAAWSVHSADFFRPVMNATYWLRGAVFGDNWGAYLYVNFAAIGAAAGTLYFCLRMLNRTTPTPDNGHSAGAVLATALCLAFVLMPPMVSSASYFQPILLPEFTFGRIMAVSCLLAALAYVYDRHLLAALLLTFALLTKEQALPMALALPLTHLWVQRRNLRTATPAVALLAAPLIAWLCVRLALYGSISQGVYVLQTDMATLLRRFCYGLLKLPLYPPSLLGALQNPLSIPALLLACNSIVLAYIALEISKRWRAWGPDIVSVAAIGYWLFLALVGTNPRYGTPLIALSILILARQPAPGVPPTARRAALAAFFITAGCFANYSLQAYPVQTKFSRMLYQVGRDYAQALTQVAPGTDTIVVLNDPNTVFTAAADMAKTLQVPVTNIYKASDYAWQWPAKQARSVPDQACQVSVRWQDAQTVAMRQSCGLQIIGGRVPHTASPILPLTDGIDVKFLQAHLGWQGYAMLMGDRMLVRIRRPHVAVLYFAPETRTFHWLKSPDTDMEK